MALTQPRRSESTTPNFSDGEIRALLKGLVDGTPCGLVTEGEVSSLLAYAWRLRVGAAILDLLLVGAVVVRWDADDWRLSLRESAA